MLHAIIIGCVAGALIGIIKHGYSEFNIYLETKKHDKEKL